MLAERLREVRTRRRMTATRLAEAAHVSKSFISQLESGRSSASLETLERISNALGVSTGTLLAPATRAASLSTASHDSALWTSNELAHGAPGVLPLSDARLEAHAVVVLPQGRTARPVVQDHMLLVAVLRGKVSVDLPGAAFEASDGDIVRVESAGTYQLKNIGTGPALALVSAPTIDALPSLVDPPESGRSALTFDATGPLRLVAMRARRAAARARQT